MKNRLQQGTWWGNTTGVFPKWKNTFGHFFFCFFGHPLHFTRVEMLEESRFAWLSANLNSQYANTALQIQILQAFLSSDKSQKEAFFFYCSLKANTKKVILAIDFFYHPCTNAFLWSVFSSAFPIFMVFGLLYNSKIKLRKKAMFLFCVLHLNKIKVMAEKHMRPKEHILWKSWEKSSLQIFAAWKVIECFYMSGLFVFQISGSCV